MTDTETDWYHRTGSADKAMYRERIVICLFTRTRGGRRTPLALAAPKLAAAVTRRSTMHSAYHAKKRGHK